MNRRRPVLGIMGGGDASGEAVAHAERLGELAALRGWVVLTGGRDAGVMAAASRGARHAGGLVIGILPFRDASEGGVSEDLDVAVFTGMGDGRNAVNVLTADVVVALPGGAGTLSEVALATKAGKPVVLLGFEDGGLFPEAARAADPEEAIQRATHLIGAGGHDV